MSIIQNVIISSILTLLITTNSSIAVDGQAGAKVLAPLTVRKDKDLSLGEFTPSRGAGGGGEIRVQNDAITDMNGVDAAIPNSGAQSARFTIIGEPNTSIHIMKDTFTTLTSGSNEMTLVLQFGEVTPEAIPASGEIAFSMDGRLLFNADQPRGRYVGSYVVDIVYG